MKPNIGDAKVSKLLSQFSIAYRNPNNIAESLLPVLNVREKTGKIAKYGKENLRAYVDQLYRAPGTRAHSVDYSVSQGTYSCLERSAEKLVPDDYINNTDKPYNAKTDATMVIMDNIFTNQELALATAMSNTAILTSNTTLSGTDQWSDTGNSDPIGDIEDGITAIRQATGQRPNTGVLNHVVFQKLKSHPAIREQVKYTGTAALSDQNLGDFLKQFFNLKNIYVGDGVYNSADEGQSASITDIWSNHFWLMYVTERPSMMMPTFGYTFSDVPRQVDTYREESKLSDVVRARYSFDQNFIDVELAYLIKDASA